MYIYITFSPTGSNISRVDSFGLGRQPFFSKASLFLECAADLTLTSNFSDVHCPPLLTNMEDNNARAADEQLLASLGYKQEFQREFTGLQASSLCLCFSLPCTIVKPQEWAR
jgi:hypothetical protein